MGDKDMTVACTIIASAEYCSEVVGALGRNVSKILEPPFNEQVSFESSPKESMLLLWSKSLIDCVALHFLSTQLGRQD